jgi:hypothetical protein
VKDEFSVSPAAVSGIRKGIHVTCDSLNSCDTYCDSNTSNAAVRVLVRDETVRSLLGLLSLLCP